MQNMHKTSNYAKYTEYAKHVNGYLTLPYVSTEQRNTNNSTSLSEGQKSSKQSVGVLRITVACVILGNNVVTAH